MNKLGFESLPRLSYTPDISMTIYCFINHPNNVLQEMVLNDQKAEAVTELIGFRTGRFYKTGINRLFS